MTDNNQRVNEQASAAGSEQTDVVEAIVRDVCELDYSDESWDHESMLSVTVGDLRLICERHIAKQSGAHAAADRAQSGKAAAANAGGLEDQAPLWLKDAELWSMWHAAQAEHPRSNNAVRSFARKIIVATIEQNIREAAHRAPATSAGELPDHIIREAVNQVRDIATQFHAHGSLRERIAGVVVPLLKARTAAVGAVDHPIMELVLDVVRLAYDAMDNTEDDGNGLHWNKPDFDALSDAMDKLEALPDDQPGYVMGPAAKARWAMRAAAQGPEAQAATQQEAKGDRDA